MKLYWSDVWVLQALKNCSSEGDLDIAALIAVADAINHSILTSEEFNNAIYRLEQVSLITVSGKSVSLCERSYELFKKYEKQSVLKQFEGVEKDLGVISYSADYEPNVLMVPNEFISKGRFNNAVQDYCKRFGI